MTADRVQQCRLQLVHDMFWALLLVQHACLPHSHTLLPTCPTSC
jgi:hypothetical protein